MARVNMFRDGEVITTTSSKTLTDVQNQLEFAKILLERHAKQIDQFALDIKQIDVVDDGSAALMTSKLGVVRQAFKALDEERKGIIQEADRFVRTVNSWAKTLKDRLDSVLKIGEPKLKEYTYRLELKRREEEKKLQQELAKRQAAMDRAAKKAGVEPVKLPDAVVISEKEKISTNEATVTYKPVWVGVITDPDQVPREFCTPDQKKIDAAVAGGLRSIPGVEIKEEMKSVWRTR